ncbi:MAG: penicillin-binding transpeptidase domain-containing protein [Sulfurimonas sp.]|uniref:penicillin-binding transpeptidase domain-containing protein n=1 Tax=Sulfurimonas sp. TaxID=2022749 RepID=UPI0026352A8B|nr:penicillin-binding transpeptidase domain-containing protein [Sulfurimonas sp.]MDD2653072.1 penicillin-binding transpeptidase domain-containing protein [Sulfurimonas sp.]MDD3452505.1 penicillin-binding transpeptidase domain-containing protein [Sulfurimonas sp.]
MKFKIALALTLLISFTQADETLLSQKLHELAKSYTTTLQAQDAYLVIMDVKTGHMVGASDSKSSDEDESLAKLKKYRFEPGNIIQPITYAIAIDYNKTTPDELLSGHKGKFAIASKYITDEYAFDYVSSENAVVHSSNIVAAQLGLRLDALELHDGLVRLGLKDIFEFDAKYKNNLTIQKLEYEIYRAVASYGYGFRVTLLDVAMVYRQFLEPTDNSFLDPTTTSYVKNTLIKAVKEGTGMQGNIQGVVVGGKTGTAHVIENGKYVNKYHTSFVGFAEDDTNSYIIGMLIVDPKKQTYASQTSAPLFKKTVEMMINMGYLSKSRNLK